MQAGQLAIVTHLPPANESESFYEKASGKISLGCSDCFYAVEDSIANVRWMPCGGGEDNPLGNNGSKLFMLPKLKFGRRAPHPTFNHVRH
jgi:hypothetical protein